MKFATTVSVLALVSGETDRKVPPRTPTQRLGTLNRFAGEWIDSQIAGAINRPGRAERMKAEGVLRLFTKMTEAYEKPCHFFDPSVPNGGPNPNSRRKKRAAFAQKKLNRISREVKDNDSLDIFDQMEDDFQRGVAGDVRALSNDPNLAWKQIGTGFRKWILRYINDCGGQKQYQYHTNRLAKLQLSVQTAYETVGASQEEDYDSFENSNNY